MKCGFENLEGRWLCAQVRSGCEIRSSYGLQERGYETFVPVFEQKRRWSDRVKIVQVPLFCGYVFLRFTIGSSLPVISAPGVIRLVGTGRTPIPIEEAEIEAIQKTTRLGLNCQPCSFLEVGQEVEVRLGPLASVRGKIVQFKNRNRLILSVNLIMRSVFVEVDGYEIVATGPFPRHDLSGRNPSITPSPGEAQDEFMDGKMPMSTHTEWCADGDNCNSVTRTRTFSL